MFASPKHNRPHSAHFNRRAPLRSVTLTNLSPIKKLQIVPEISGTETTTATATDQLQTVGDSSNSNQVQSTGETTGTSLPNDSHVRDEMPTESENSDNSAPSLDQELSLTSLSLDSIPSLSVLAQQLNLEFPRDLTQLKAQPKPRPQPTTTSTPTIVETSTTATQQPIERETETKAVDNSAASPVVSRPTMAHSALVLSNLENSQDGEADEELELPPTTTTAPTTDETASTNINNANNTPDTTVTENNTENTPIRTSIPIPTLRPTHTAPLRSPVRSPVRSPIRSPTTPTTPLLSTQPTTPPASPLLSTPITPLSPSRQPFLLDKGSSSLWFKYYRRGLDARRQGADQRRDRDLNQWDAVDLDAFFADLPAIRAMTHDELLKKLESVCGLYKQNKEDENRFLSLLVDLKQRLEDSQLSILSRRMREIVGFKDLIQISNTVIDSIIGHVDREIARGIRPGRKTILELVKESAQIRKVNNDVAEGINQPTLDKLQQFNREYNSAKDLQRASPKKPEPTTKSPLQRLTSIFS